MPANARHFGQALLVALVLGATLAPRPALALLAVPDDPKSTARRIALVIGNGAYRSAPVLRNPASDARAVAAKLDALGFAASTAIDASTARMRTMVSDFAEAARHADVALVFFAGTGVQIDGRSRLVGIDSATSDAKAVIDGSLDVRDIAASVSANASDTVLIIDACTDDPFSAHPANTRGLQVSPGGSPGTASHVLDEAVSLLAPDGRPHGVYIAYSAEPGRIALDGPGDHSPFAAALLAALDRPGIPLDALMADIRKDVWRETNGRQRPWSSSTLTETVVLHP